MHVYIYIYISLRVPSLPVPALPVPSLPYPPPLSPYPPPPTPPPLPVPTTPSSNQSLLHGNEILRKGNENHRKGSCLAWPELARDTCHVPGRACPLHDTIGFVTGTARGLSGFYPASGRPEAGPRLHHHPAPPSPGSTITWLHQN